MNTRPTRQTNSIQLFLMFLTHHVESCGVPESALRHELHLEEGWLKALPHDELVALVPRILVTAQRLVEDEQICLHAGEHFHFCLAGAGGLAATHAPTPGLALETFGRFVSGDELVRVDSSTSGGQTIFRVSVTELWPKGVREQIVEGFFSGMVAALRAVCGSSCTPIETRFTRTEPSDTKSYLRAIRGKLTFQCARNELVIGTEELTKASLLYEPLLYEQLLFITDLNTDRPAGSSPLRQLVEQAIRAGDNSIDQVAETLQITRRTLQRRLNKEGVTFRSVLNKTRVHLAEAMLLESNLSITEIATRLHYSDDKAFRKAVKAITGMTPTEVRSQVDLLE